MPRELPYLFGTRDQGEKSPTVSRGQDWIPSDSASSILCLFSASLATPGSKDPSTPSVPRRPEFPRSESSTHLAATVFSFSGAESSARPCERACSLIKNFSTLQGHLKPSSKSR
ncbi:hypothetical protein B0H17DRAFT_559969 [Mycena rosella]|uniref:Uncharacterized protein n=1 Tax=Mycena rosella TaxID=1033263 RepID=A0AAD7BPI3_MYCRO|nr:hypothetical protein B0H17DRAFT_559969 [Mycena rosella]